MSELTVSRDRSSLSRTARGQLAMIKDVAEVAMVVIDETDRVSRYALESAAEKVRRAGRRRALLSTPTLSDEEFEELTNHYLNCLLALTGAYSAFCRIEVAKVIVKHGGNPDLIAPGFLMLED